MFWNLLLDTASGSPAPTDGAGAAAGCFGGNNWWMFIILGVLIVVLIAVNFLMNRKQKKQAQETMSKLKVGDTIVTIGGVKGTVVEIDETDNTVTIETGVGANASTVTFYKNAIQAVNPDRVAAAASSASAETVEETPSEDVFEQKGEETDAKEEPEVSPEGKADESADGEDEKKD